MKPGAFLQILASTAIGVLGLTMQVYGQSAASLLQSAKQEFKKDYTAQNMPQTVLDLKKALALSPNNPEISYHLAYALDRVYTADGSWIASSNLTKVEEISKYLEQTIRLSPRYTGEKLPLDPYSKLGSIWGNLALGFLSRNLPDSARWAFQEGKRKGAYSEPQLELGRNLINGCSKNAILFSAGDNFSFPLFYLQTVENLRKDVQVLDINLLNSDWYCLYLAEFASNSLLREGLSIDAIPNLVSWKTGSVSTSINNAACEKGSNFEWNIPKLINGDFLLRSEYLLLQTIIGNQFVNDIYFTAGFPKDDLLYLDSFLEFGVLLQRLSPCKIQRPKTASDYLRNYSINSLTQHRSAIANSPDLVNQLNFYRIGYANAIYQLIETEKMEDAKALMAAMETRLPTGILPLFSPTLGDYIARLKESLN
jgi:hypothetical protein